VKPEDLWCKGSLVYKSPGPLVSIPRGVQAVKEEAMSNRDFLQTVVSLLGEFRANGARRVIINFSGERDRQLADSFVLK
jgi:hypothetical protein